MHCEPVCQTKRGGRGEAPPCVYVYKSYLKNFYAAQANSMPGKTCFVASGKLLAEVAGECRCGAQGRASKSVCLARTHSRTCLGSDFIQFDFLSVRV